MSQTAVQIGRYNNLEVIKEVDFGVYLDGGEHGNILLPLRYVPERCKIGDIMRVFIYLDSEDDLIATTETPKAQVGDFACLKVIDVNNAGAFADWGLPKDLMIPYGQQKNKLQKDQLVVVYLYLDAYTNRIVGSSKIDKFLNQEPARYRTGQEVSLLVCDRTEIGYTTIINDKHWGVLFHNDLPENVSTGFSGQGFIKRVRPDGKIDLSITKPGYDKSGINDLGQQILEKLKQNNGHLPLHDKSNPELIKKMFGVSKRNFKHAIGGLYKQRLIRIENDGIHIV
ncbi:CvfB family protein [Endozoicomonadaceae bacterium StTr2]